MSLLTAEDVLNKAFTKTKYREGFDQDEVDDFLDEIADTITTLTQQRDELAQKLREATANGVATGAVAQVPASVPAVDSATSLLAAATDPTPVPPTQMLAMAQKLHDEYVKAGEEEKERILVQARAKADEIVQAATANAENEAKSKTLELEAVRLDLERTIDDLRRFEKDYRNHLKSYLENLLGDLEFGASKAKDAEDLLAESPVGAAFVAPVNEDFTPPASSFAEVQTLAAAEPVAEEPVAPVAEEISPAVAEVFNSITEEPLAENNQPVPPAAFTPTAYEPVVAVGAAPETEAVSEVEPVVAPYAEPAAEFAPQEVPAAASPVEAFAAEVAAFAPSVPSAASQPVDFTPQINSQFQPSAEPAAHSFGEVPAQVATPTPLVTPTPVEAELPSPVEDNAIPDWQSIAHLNPNNTQQFAAPQVNNPPATAEVKSVFDEVFKQRND